MQQKPQYRYGTRKGHYDQTAASALRDMPAVSSLPQGVPDAHNLSVITTFPKKRLEKDSGLHSVCMDNMCKARKAVREGAQAWRGKNFF